jgi:hypothetical protein
MERGRGDLARTHFETARAIAGELDDAELLEACEATPV